MLFSVNRLIKHHREARIYVTEVTYSRGSEPNSIFMFLPEDNTEIEVSVYSVLHKRKLRSRDETLYHLQVTRDHTLLLLLDHKRGNHYVYCRAETLKHLLHHLNDIESYENVLQSSREEVATDTAPHSISNLSQQSETIDDLNGKIVHIDTESICLFPELLGQLAEQNDEVVLSPYYDMELDDYTTSVADRNEIITLIENARLQFPTKIISNLYVNPDVVKSPLVDLSDPHQYVLELANQQSALKSQIMIVTANENVQLKAKMQGYHVYVPREFTGSRAIDEAPQSQAASWVPDYGQGNSLSRLGMSPAGGFPPRSQRKTKKASLGMVHSIKSFFYYVF